MFKRDTTRDSLADGVCMCVLRAIVVEALTFLRQLAGGLVSHENEIEISSSFMELLRQTLNALTQNPAPALLRGREEEFFKDG